MIRRPPRSTLTDTLFPYTTLFRSLVKLTAAERRVRDIAFQSLDPVPVKRLLRSGKWIDFAQTECLTRQGKISEYLYLIAEGEASVRVGEQEVARLVAGRLVGEIGLLALQVGRGSCRGVGCEDVSTSVVIVTLKKKKKSYKKTE